MLYTIRPDQLRCIVGYIFNVEIVENYEEELKKIKPLFDKYFQTMQEELKNVNANVNFFGKNKILPNVKFKWQEANLFQQPIPVDFLDGPAFNRFQGLSFKRKYY